jgi:hypothetical protein
MMMQNQGPDMVLHVGPGKVGLGLFIRSPGIACFIVFFFFVCVMKKYLPIVGGGPHGKS